MVVVVPEEATTATERVALVLVPATTPRVNRSVQEEEAIGVVGVGGGQADPPHTLMIRLWSLSTLMEHVNVSVVALLVL